MSSPPRLFRHEILGVVALVSETGFASQRRFVVRDASGMNHTLLASYARLRPVDPASEDVRRFLELAQATPEAAADQGPSSADPGSVANKFGEEIPSPEGPGPSVGPTEDFSAPIDDDDELPF